MSKDYDFIRYALSFVGSQDEVKSLKKLSGFLCICKNRKKPFF